jgi:hypothetical protein
MDRRRRLDRPDAGPLSPDAATNRRPRRAVVDSMRRKIERALAVSDAAEGLAKAAQAVLIAVEADQIVLNSARVNELRAALSRYREVRSA